MAEILRTAAKRERVHVVLETLEGVSFAVPMYPPTEAVQERAMEAVRSYSDALEEVELEFPKFLEYLTLSTPAERLAFQTAQKLKPTSEASALKERKRALELPYLREFFLAAADLRQMDPERLALLMTPPDGEFWRNQDLEELRSLESAFRAKLGI